MNFSKKSHGLIVASGLSFLLAFSPMGSAFAEETSTEEAANVVAAGTDPAAKNLEETRNYTNPDLSVLPDNVNWDGEREGLGSVNTFDGAVKLPNTSTPYTVVDTKKFPGTDGPLIGNADEFGWDLNNGAVSISKEGKAYTNGTGESGIINPESKKNILWLGQYAPQGETSKPNEATPASKQEKEASIVKRFYHNWGLPLDKLKFSVEEGDFCQYKSGHKLYWAWENCDTEGVDPSTKTHFTSHINEGIGRYRMMGRYTFGDGSYRQTDFVYSVSPHFNVGVKQAVDVTPGSEIVITPSWVSNGNANGTDQLQLRIYDATGKQISDFPYWSTDRPVMLYKGSTNRPEVGTQGFVWKVPEGVTRIFTTFRQADETADHTGLADKSAVALTGFTGATVTTGSHLTMAAAATNDPAKQIVNKPFDFELVVTSDGYAATANGEFSAELPQGVTAESVVVKTADGKEVAGTIKDGKIVVPLSKMNVGDKVTVLLKGIKLPVAQKWNLLNPVLSYNTFALNGGYTDAAEFTDSFHIVHPYTISLTAQPVSTVDQGTQTDPTDTADQGTQTEPTDTTGGAANQESDKKAEAADQNAAQAKPDSNVEKPAEPAKATKGKKRVAKSKGLPTTGSGSLGAIGVAGAILLAGATVAATRRNRKN
ncbi:hypothetical protein [Propionimicrobium lymphophilum]|uniref:hypothetical protein n=1 Tax=Propionimicrobium lymphophilum TaxID=33012 RepID=UPI0023F5562F|nr:hypothetical protein [Propionimicrobium lymphophilum]